VGFLNTGWSLSRETFNAEPALVRGMSGIARGVGWWILTIGILRDNGHAKRQISFGTFLSERKVP